MRVPVVLITGTDPEAMATTMVGLQFDMPYAVAVRHQLDPVTRTLERVVSDVTGVVEREVIELEHACVPCAIREDVLPTVERVARDPRWRTVLVHLPVGAPAGQVCAVLASDTRLARHLRVASVVTALRGPHLAADLLSDVLLADRGLHQSPEDRRGLGEVTAAMIEYADVLVVSGDVLPTDLSLVRTLARPDALLVTDPSDLETAAVTGQVHQHGRTRAWTDPRLDTPATASSDDVWVVDLESDRPFDPARLLDGLDALGGGRHRSRGCFWLPTRPHHLLVWDGAGGQLSIGDGGFWGARPARTRLRFVGIGAAPAHLDAAFRACLSVGPTLLGAADEDGFEPWLGPIRGVA